MNEVRKGGRERGDGWMKGKGGRGRESGGREREGKDGGRHGGGRGRDGRRVAGKLLSVTLKLNI